MRLHLLFQHGYLLVESEEEAGVGGRGGPVGGGHRLGQFQVRLAQRGLDAPNS
ncbi:hypothetical protein [Streptomyces coffeae]|uniref:Uncharacterized protein n=1 Tax=Streptomyces coffeae TaxID=621382 RepID=A0ABS1NCC2_9ACTN|nr:hypothetical protein [Streptomyces coffeae]MBL1097698.1 hypothetical protein [Streptomyces coffeae]